MAGRTPSRADHRPGWSAAPCRPSRSPRESRVAVETPEPRSFRPARAGPRPSASSRSAGAGGLRRARRPGQHAVRRVRHGAGVVSGPERLALGARFGMSMRIKVPRPHRQHRGRVRGGPTHRVVPRQPASVARPSSSRSTTPPLSSPRPSTGARARFPPSLLLMNASTNNQIAVATTLVRLKTHVEHRSRRHPPGARS